MKNVIAKYDQNVFKQQNQTKAWNPKHALKIIWELQINFLKHEKNNGYTFLENQCSNWNQYLHKNIKGSRENFLSYFMFENNWFFLNL